jgi:hypothetical protein
VERQRAEYELLAGLAELRVFALSPVSKIARWTAASRGGAPVAAVNGDFFELNPGNYQGDPRGIHVYDGELVSDSPPHFESFWIEADGTPRIGRVETRLTVAWSGCAGLAVGLNANRPDDQAVLYTPRLGLSPGERHAPVMTTRTGGGVELVLARKGDTAWLPLGIGRRLDATVREIRREGNTPLSYDTLVLSLGPAVATATELPAPGATVSVAVESTPDLAGARTAIGGGVALVKDGESRQKRRNPDDPRHPRTAVGWNATHWVLVVVDGRQPGLSVGMTYPELADAMLELGCTDALELDGGGSSTMWFNGQVRNSPSDGEQRGVANALVLIRRPPPRPTPTE